MLTPPASNASGSEQSTVGTQLHSVPVGHSWPVQTGDDQEQTLARGEEADTYGLHLTLRAYEIEDRPALGDAVAVDRFLVALVGALEMTVLAGPLVGVESGPPASAGVSGLVILCESHAAIHTYPVVGEAFVDVFSCRTFDPGVVETTIRAFFGGHRVKEPMLAARGRHWQADISGELRRWRESRAGPA
jgi:S-adenosylmethionine decarboxylase